MLIKKVYIETTVFLLILLFAYTAYNKFLEITPTQHVLEHYPLIGSFAVFFSWLIPICEIMVIILLMVPKVKMLGIASAATLLSSFSVYIIYLLSVSTELPCTCGGMIRDLTWTQHLIFNVSFIILAIIALKLGFPDIKKLWEKA